VTTRRTASASVVKILERVEKFGAFHVTAHFSGDTARITKADLFYRVSKGGKTLSDHGSRDGALLTALEHAKGRKFLDKFPEAWWSGNAPVWLFGYETKHANEVIKIAKAAGCYETGKRKVS